MTGFADSEFHGAAKTNIAPRSAGGFGFGPTGRTYLLDIVPLTLNATGYAASQSPGASALALSAGAGVTAIVDAFGVTRYVADVPRGVTISSGGNDTGITFLVRGYDQYGAPTTQTVTGTNGSTATTLKAFMSIISVQPSASVASTVTAGTADLFGLPVCVVDAGYISNIGWNNILADNGGTLAVADQTSPATSLTGDVRGTYAQSGAASNGARRLVIEILLSELNIGIGQTVIGVLGQPQV